MNRRILVLGVVLPVLLTLSGCWGKKPQKVTPKKKKSEQIAMPVAGDDQSIQLSFFDEEVGAFEDVESFVLDDDANQDSDITLAFNDSDGQLDFSLEEPAVQPDQETQVVHFDYDSFNVKDDQKSTIADVNKKISKWTKQNLKVVFKGHACKWHGTRAYNLALSGQRAQWIADMCNIPKDNIKVFGVGNEEPMVFENSKDGQSANRRVEIYPIAA